MSWQARNEDLARSAAALSEQDAETMRLEFEARLGAAERKVYALTKERDALRRGAEKHASVADLVKEKDAIIQQVWLFTKSVGGLEPAYMALCCNRSRSASVL